MPRHVRPPIFRGFTPFFIAFQAHNPVAHRGHFQRSIARLHMTKHMTICFFHWSQRVALAWVLIFGASAAAAQSPTVPWLQFDQAQVVYSDDPLALSRVGSQRADWQAVRLPDAWARHSPPSQGVALYRLTFDVPPAWPANERLSVFIPRVGNRFSLEINGQWLGASGVLTDHREDHVHQPQHFWLPYGALRTTGNELLIEVHGELARYAGLGEVWLGPSQVIQSMHASRRAWQSGGALVIVGLALMMGVLALGFGVAMGARVQVLFGMAAVLWGIRNTYVLVLSPPLPHPWWGILMDLLYGWAVALLALSVLLTLRAKNKASMVVLGLLLLSTMTLPVLHGLTGLTAFRQYWLLSLLVAVAFVAGRVLWHGWRNKTFESKVLSVSAVLALALGLYDHLAIVYGPSGYSQFALSRFAFLFILLAMSALLMRRVWRSIQAAKRFRGRLQARLARAASMLARFHSEREKKQIQDAELAERLRLLREMHDGVGAHLVTLHSMLRNPESSRNDLENELEQAGQALRDSLGALREESQTWLVLLVSLRESLESRLRHAGVVLIWQVENLGELPLPGAQAQRHFRMLMGECVTNVIKHAQARQVTLQAHRTPDLGPMAWVVRVSDDGQGMQTPKSAGHGLLNMQTHAQSIQAQLRVLHLHPGTCIELTFNPS
jgi:signal transduction histidine kinase